LEQGAPTWSCERSMPTKPGEAVLAMAPTFGESWTVMLALRNDEGQLVIETAQIEIGEGGVEAAGDTILDRFAAHMIPAQSLRIIPVGSFVPVEFHRLWLARGFFRPVITYSLGLGVLDTEGQRERTAVVVAGSEDLGDVTTEVSAVSSQLRDSGWAVSDRWAFDEIIQPTLLHYAGHGIGSDRLGWDSGIDLPGVGTTTAAQIVAGQRSPELVVLGACSAAQIHHDAIDGGMNIAAAFLLAGARLVIAPTRDVDDRTAYQLGVNLYQDFGNAEPLELVLALSRMQQEQLERDQKRIAAESFTTWRAWTP
jgi:hypothetical protein